MGLAAHIDLTAHEHIFGVFGMERFDLRVLGLGEIEDVVALHGLVQEGQAQGEDDQRDDDKLAAQDLVAHVLAAYVKHDAEARLAAQHVIVGFGYAFEGKGLVHGPDARENTKVKRVFGIDGRARVPAVDGLILQEHLDSIHLERWNRADHHELSFDGETRENGFHGFGAGDGGKDNLGAAQFLQLRRGILRFIVDVIMGAELAGQGLFVLTARDGSNFAAHFCSELHTEMAKSADADYSDKVAGP